MTRNNELTDGRLRPAPRPIRLLASHIMVLWRQACMAVYGSFARKVMSLSALTAAGQLSFLVALPLLSRIYSPADFGIFTIYLSIVNIGGPLVGLKFDSALYAARTGREARATLVLCLLTIFAMSGLATFALFAFSGKVGEMAGLSARRLELILPFGLLLSGLWSASSAWATRSQATTILGMARFGQPAIMTLLQLVAGIAMSVDGMTLVIAHLLSHLFYSTFIFSFTLTRENFADLRLRALRALPSHASRIRAFPLFVLPAQISVLSVSNLPPLLLSLVYGAGIAGHVGIAYRLVAVPLTVASMPLGAIFTSIVSRNPSPAATDQLARKVFVGNFFLVALPVLALGLVAPRLAPVALGDRWALTGEIVEAFALLGAAQSLSTPFSEITTIFRAQALRMTIEVVTALVVVAAIGVGALSGWTALETIWAMSAAGAVSSTLGLFAVFVRLRMLADRTPGDGVASKTAGLAGP